MLSSKFLIVHTSMKLGILPALSHDHIGQGLPIHGVFFMTEVNGCVTWEMMQMYILQLEVLNG